MSNARRLSLALASAGFALAVVLTLRQLDLLPRLRGGGAGGRVLQNDGSALRGFLQERAASDEPGVLIGEMPEEHARLVFAMLGSAEVTYDPALYFRRVAGLVSGRRFPEVPQGVWQLKTNSQGFREDEELPEDPDARVLVIGDSHTDGVCRNRRSFANRLEWELNRLHPERTLDVVNAGVGGYSFYNYLRGLNAYVEALDVDVYVCAVYGGNDFLETLAPRHYFARTALPTGGAGYARALEGFTDAWGGDIDAVVAQGVQQLAFLTQEPEEADLALDTAITLTRRMAQRADELGVALVFVYLPPAWDVQLERYTAVPRAELERALGLEGGRPRTHDAWAERWMDVVAELGLTCLDMRAAWRAVDEDRYWHQDHHINLHAQDDVAAALLPMVEPLLGL